MYTISILIRSTKHKIYIKRSVVVVFFFFVFFFLGGGGGGGAVFIAASAKLTAATVNVVTGFMKKIAG